MMTPRRDDRSEVFTSTQRLLQLEADGRLPDFHGRQRNSSLLAGRHCSRMRGRGLDFDELRRYTQGDDIRHLDWRATQRTGTPLVRSFTEERDRPTLILCDQRLDMLFGSTLLMKATAAAEISALLAWISFHAGDRVGGIIFNDQQIDTVTPHRSRQRLTQLFTRIAKHNQSLSVDNPAPRISDQLDRVLSRALANSGHDQTICIVSDFAGLSDRSLSLLQKLALHNDVLAVQVYEPLGMNLPKQGLVSFGQDKVSLKIDLGQGKPRQQFENFLMQRFKNVDESLRRSGLPHLKISCAEPVLPQLRRALGLMQVPR